MILFLISVILIENILNVIKMTIGLYMTSITSGSLGDDWDILSGSSLTSGASDYGTVSFRVYNSGSQSAENVYVTVSALRHTIAPTDSYDSKSLLLCTGSIIELMCSVASENDGGAPAAGGGWTKVNWDEPFSGSDFDWISHTGSHNYNTYSLRFDPATGDYDAWQTGTVELYISVYGEPEISGS